MFIEPLESRIAPASLVTVAYDAKTGILTLTGDAADNELFILKAASGKGYQVQAGTNTSIDGAASQDFAKLTAVKFIGGGGTDYIELKGISLTALDMEGTAYTANLENVSITGALTAKSTAESVSLMMQGTVKVGKDLTVQSAGVANILAITNQFEVKGHLGVTAGAGNDDITISATKTVTIGKGASFDLGDGEGSIVIEGQFIPLPGAPSPGPITLGKAADGTSLSITGGTTGSDIVAAVKSTAIKMAGSVKFVGGPDLASHAGGNELTIEGQTVAISGKNAAGNSLEFQGSTEEDKLTVRGDKSLKLAGGLQAAVGDKNDVVTLVGANPSIGKNLAGNSLELTTDGGTDEFTVGGSGNVTLAGKVLVTSGTGAAAGTDDEVKLGIGTDKSVKVGAVNGVSIEFNGSGGSDLLNMIASTVSLAGAIDYDAQGFVGGSIGDLITLLISKSMTIGATKDTGDSVRMSSGGNVTLGQMPGIPPTLTAFTTKGGLDLDGDISFGALVPKVSIGKNKAGLSLDLDGGGQGDQVIFAGSTITFAGATDINFGGGINLFRIASALAGKADKVSLGSVTVVGGGGDDTVSVEALKLTSKAVNLDLGAGDDEVKFIGDGTVTGDFIANLGTSTLTGTQVATIGGSTVTPKILAISGALSVLADANTTGWASLLVDRLSVAKAMQVSLGNAETTMSIDNLTAKSSLTVTGGNDEDTLNFETAGVKGRSKVTGAVSIDLGLGDDTLYIGAAGSVDDAVDFLGAVTIDDAGGAGDRTNADILTVNKYKIAATFNAGAFEIFH